MAIEKSSFGVARDGQELSCYTLTNNSGMSVKDRRSGCDSGIHQDAG